MLLDIINKHKTIMLRYKLRTLPFMTREMNINFKATRNKAWALSRKLIENYKDAFTAASKTSPKNFWKYSLLLHINLVGTQLLSWFVIESSQMTPQKLLMHWITSLHQHSNLQIAYCPLPTPPHYIINTQVSAVIVDKAELESGLKKLNPNNSVGPDGIHPQLLTKAPN